MLASITPRQRAVMDLVIEHRTSKEIARELGIAPNTVDQRINAVRNRLGARDRAETARLYSNLLLICGETTCGFPVIAFDAEPPLSRSQEDGLSPVFTLNDASVLHAGSWSGLEQVGDLRARIPDNKLVRLGIIVGIAAGTAIVVAAVLAMMNALNTLV